MNNLATSLFSSLHKQFTLAPTESELKLYRAFLLVIPSFSVLLSALSFLIRPEPPLTFVARALVISASLIVWRLSYQEWFSSRYLAWCFQGIIIIACFVRNGFLLASTCFDLPYVLSGLGIMMLLAIFYGTRQILLVYLLFNLICVMGAVLWCRAYGISIAPEVYHFVLPTYLAMALASYLSQVVRIQFTERNKELFAELNLANSEIRASQQHLATNEANLRMLIENASDSVWLIDTEYRYIVFNSTFQERMKTLYNVTPMLGGTVEFDQFPEDIRQRWHTELQRAFAGEHVTEEAWFTTAFASVYLEYSCNPIRDTNGIITGVAVFTHDITVSRLANIALEQAKQEAEQANRMKSAFIANMSHEVRTPLNAVIGFTNILLADTNTLSNKQRQYLETILSSSNHLLSLLNDLLDLSRIEANKIHLAPEPCELHRFLEELEHTFRQRCEEKQLDFRLDAEKTLPRTVVIDRKRLRQVLINLLGNAVKYTERGSITLTVRLEYLVFSTATFTFTVTDTGRGIAPERLHTIAEPFSHNTGQNFSEGLGLGLALTKRLLQLMNSTLTIQSSVGKGSTFSFALDAELVQSPALPLTPEAATTIFKKPCGIKAQSQRNAPLRALIADDIENNRALMRILLESVGIRCEEAADGLAAVTMAQEARPDLILMDLSMPELDGQQAAKRISAFAQTLAQAGVTYKPAIVGVSAHVLSPDEQALLFGDGFTRFLPKPFQQPDFFDAVAQALDIEYILSQDAALPTSSVLPTQTTTPPHLINLADIAQAVADHTEFYRLQEAITFQEFDEIERLLNNVETLALPMQELRRQAERRHFTFFINLAVELSHLTA
jgi:PAS domain S-box-containing protein